MNLTDGSESERRKRCSVSKIESSVYTEKSKEGRKYWLKSLQLQWYWYGVWDGDATVTERKGATGGSEVTASKQMRKGRIKGGWNGRTNTSTKRGKTKAQTGTSLDPMKLFFVQGGIYSSEERDRPLLKSGKVMEV